MDPATLIGIVVAFGALVAMLTIEGSQITADGSIADIK